MSAQNAVSAVPESAAPKVRRILVADDNCDAGETLAMLLRLDGHEVHVANDGLGALGLADASWLELHGIQGFAAFPLRREGANVGVLALFSRRRLEADDVRGLSAAAELLAMALPTHTADRTIRPLREVERDAIERALVQTGGRVSGPRGAARVLGLKATTLQSRMKKLGVRRPPR